MQNEMQYAPRPGTVFLINLELAQLVAAMEKHVQKRFK